MVETHLRSSEAGKEGRPKGSERLFSIGQLVRELHSEFPDLSISKVRYLEDRGLISPQRTKGKYESIPETTCAFCAASWLCNGTSTCLWTSSGSEWRQRAAL